MTTLAITPNWKNKSAKFKGTVAAGEHVSVTIQNDDGEGGEFIADASTLRLRVVNPCNGRTLAIFPEPVPEGETPETWDSDLSPLRCTLNLNTVQMLKAVPPAANVSLLFVLDDYDNNTLYFKEQFPVEHWPRLRGEEEPTDLDNYKDIIADFNTRLDGYDTRITGAENAAQAATANASAAAAKANQAVGIANQAVDKAETAQNSAAASAEAAHNSALAAEEAQEAAESAAESINSPDATLTEEGVAAEAKATGEAIAAEKTRAETAEAAEETRAKGIESGLRTDLTAAQEAIDDEAILRAAADADLEANKADKTAVAAISSDVAAAQTAISNLSANKADKATTYTKTEVDAKVAGVQTFQKYLVQTLPDLATADMKGLYLVPTGETSEEGDLCEEWTVVETGGERRWEKIGGTTVDLSDYYTKGEANALLAGKQVKLVVPGGGIRWVLSTESTGTEIEAFMADADSYTVTEEDAGTGKKYTVTGYDTTVYFVTSTVTAGAATVVDFFVFDATETDLYGQITATRTAVDADVPAQVDTTPTKDSGKLATSGGIWSAIWGALASLPTGFSSLYGWVVDQLAGKLDKSGGTMTGTLTAPMFNVQNGANGGLCLNYADYNATIHYHGASGVYIAVKQGSSGRYYIDFQDKGGTLALAAANPTSGNLAALDANGNPTDSGIAAGDLLTTVTLSDSTETMASILARLNAINAAHRHVFFDCSGIDVNPRLYLCTIMIDADANAVRVYDQVTGKLYIGPYDAAETIGEVFAKAVDAYHSITVSAVTLDGVTVTGQTVTIREGTDATAPVYATATITDGAPVVFVVPKGMIYYLEITDSLAVHFGPRVTSGAQQGIATADAAVTFTYYDAEHIDVSEITTFAKLQEALTWFGTNEAAARNNLVGIEIADTWTATNGTVYDNPRVVWDVHYFEDEDGVSHLGALMGTKYCSHNDVQFDAAEGEECDSSTETVAEAGVYYYGLALGQTSKTAANLTLLELSAGDSLPYADYAKIYKSAIRDTTRNSLQYGYNNWRDSAYRQYLNSDAATGQWWGATHIGDIAPSQLNSVRGFMAGCSAALLAAAKKVKVATWPNYITDGPNQITTVYETLDTFFLPSGSEVYGDVNRSGGASVEGELSPYWQARTGYTAPNSAATSTRIIYRELPVGSTANRSAAGVRLRSAARGNSHAVCSVTTSGQVNFNYAAYTAIASVPACVIY